MQILIFQNNRYKRLALIGNKKLLEYYEFFDNDKENLHDYRGNIYIGEIVRIEPKLNAVFVNFGQSKPGFLSLNSIHPKYFNLEAKDQDILISKLKKELDLKGSDIFTKNQLYKYLNLGQKLIVQVIRNERFHKGVMLSTFISLKGKYIKYIPNSINSRFIVGENNCQTNIEIIKRKLEDFSGSFSIFNTENVEENEIIKDFNGVIHIWNNIKNKYGETGDILFEDDNFKHIFDSLTQKTNNIILEGEIALKELKINNNKYNIKNGFNTFKDFEKQVESIYSNIVGLSNGSYLIFEETQSVTAIDINMGNNNGKLFEENIFNVNKFAIQEIFKQFVLRNIGGIIIIDLIGMKNQKNIEKLEEIIEELAQNDEQKIEFAPISKFGILEVCRQYNQQNRSYYDKCNSCRGGKILSISVLAEKILREIYYKCEDYDYIEIHLSKELAEFIMNNMNEDIISIRENLNVVLNFMVVQHTNSNFYQIL